MSRYDFRTPRLHVEAALAAGGKLALDGSQVNYLRNVLRLKGGDPVLVFNGRDGEWRATLADVGKMCAEEAKSHGLSVVFRQTNYEGELVTWIQEARTKASALILNAGAYTHTSMAVHDSLLALTIPASPPTSWV